MPQDPARSPLSRPAVRAQDIDIEGHPYVLVPKAEYERLCLRAEGPREHASLPAFGSVGHDLRDRRHRAGLTLAAVAGRAGIRQETLSRIENKRTNPSVGTVQAILRALEASP